MDVWEGDDIQNDHKGAACVVFRNLYARKVREFESAERWRVNALPTMLVEWSK